MLAAMTQTSLIPVAQSAAAAPAALGEGIAALKPGQIITAKVLEILGSSLARLDIGGAKLDVRSETPLEIGMKLALKVERSGPLTRLVPVDGKGNAANGAGAQATGAKQPAAARAGEVSPSRAPAGESSAMRAGAGQEAARLNTGARPSAVVLSGRAAGPQSAPAATSSPSAQTATISAAPASAPAKAPLTSAQTPSQTSAQTPTNGSGQAVQIERMAEAVRQLQPGDGVARPGDFNPVKALQIKLAEDAAVIMNSLKSVRAGESQTAGQAPSPGGKPAPAPGEAARASLTHQVSQDAGRQASAAALFADAARLMETAPGKLPPKLSDALSKLLQFRVPAEGKLAGETVQKAFIRSGVLLEARLAEAVRQMEGGQKFTPPGADLKSSLLDLKQKLGDFLSRQPAAGTSAKLAGAAQKPDLPPPPLRAGAMQGQPAAEPSLSPRLSAAQTAQVLMDEASSAISRLRLLQNASLPPQSESGRGAPTRLEWNFEIPLALAGRTDMAQLRIEGEGGADIEPVRRLWSVQVALDTEQTGSVNGAVMLQGRAISVQLMAEREEIAQQFKAHAGELEQNLREAGLEVERLHIRSGKRRAAKSAPGHMVDQSR